MEVGYGGTIENVLVSIINHVRLGNGRKGDHLTLGTRMPGHTTDKTLGGRSARIVINLLGTVSDLHWVSCVDGLIIGHKKDPRGVGVPLVKLVQSS